MKVAIIGGAGYVGLVTGVGLARIGHDVVNVDIDSARIETLSAGTCYLHEEELETLLRENLSAARLHFTTSMAEATRRAQVIFIAVGTPPLKNGQADLSQVIQVAEELAGLIDQYTVIVVKSTVPVGSVELIRTILARSKIEGEEFDVVVNPEFLREGKGLWDFFYPDRIVIGTASPKAGEIIRDLYAPIIDGRASFGERPSDRRVPVPVVETDIASAQLIKYASNAFLATRISFINELAGLAERVGADIREVVRGMGYDPRIGHGYLEPGMGFGGPCLDKDLRALIKIAEENRHEPGLLRAVLERNEQQLKEIVSKIKSVTGNLLYRRVIAVYGLAFKAGTNDVRNSLPIRLIEELEREGAIARAYDPVAIPAARLIKPEIEYTSDPYEAARKAEVLVIGTDWPQFKEMDYAKIRRLMTRACIVDGRNMLDGPTLQAQGFTYVGIGRRLPES